MAQELVEMAKDLVMALIKADMLEPEDMQSELHKTHASLLQLKSREEGGESNGVPSVNQTAGQVNWKKSIKKYSVDCLVCGATFKQLSARHLRTHDLDPRSYRDQFGIPRSQPLSAKETTALRKRVVQATRPWEKAPTYLKGREQEAASEAVAPPKRTRKKAPARRA
ncbi:hypothetical protein C2W62_12855 [Candidatus Entotheonella serta]|nr:hypothetical protein C2W62_12855 [Candidatus Entotheonella serta]